MSKFLLEIVVFVTRAIAEGHVYIDELRVTLNGVLETLGFGKDYFVPRTVIEGFKEEHNGLLKRIEKLEGEKYALREELAVNKSNRCRDFRNGNIEGHGTSNRIPAIKLLRTMSLNRLSLKEAKDAVETLVGIFNEMKVPTGMDFDQALEILAVIMNCLGEKPGFNTDAVNLVISRRFFGDTKCGSWNGPHSINIEEMKCRNCGLESSTTV